MQSIYTGASSYLQNEIDRGYHKKIKVFSACLKLYQIILKASGLNKFP